jgi:hypothetical protein
VDAAGLPPQVEHLPLPATPDGIARSLYAALREVDRRGCEVVLVTLPPEAGLGLAVGDRLRRATGRPSAATNDRDARDAHVGEGAVPAQAPERRS